MIAKRAIVRMLLNGHYLNAVISIFNNTRKNILFKLLVGAHLLGILSHSNVTLVDEQRIGVWAESFLLPHILLLRSPHLSRENSSVLILHHPVGPCRNALTFSPIPFHVHLVMVAMPYCLCRHLQFPVACAFNSLATKSFCFLPVVEVANKINISGIRRPLSEHPSSAVFVQTIVIITTGKIGKLFLAISSKLREFPQYMVMTPLYSILVGSKIPIILYNTNMFWFNRLSYCLTRIFLCHIKIIFVFIKKL